MKKTILHVLAMSSYSGAENVVCQIIEMFKDDIDSRMVYCSPDGSIRKVLSEKKIKFEPMSNLSVGELKRVIRKVNPTIIHAHDVRATLFSSICRGDAKLISHIHNNWENLRKVSLKGMLYYVAARKASEIIWVSESAFNQYKYSSKLKNKSTILKNIINVDQIRGAVANSSCNKKYDIINIGRLTYQKNPERLINVIEKVVKRKPKLKAALIGEGELAEHIKELIQEKKLGSNIELLGYIDNPLGYVKNAKVFLLTSRWEGTPMAVLESLALGTPVVGTPVDGMLDLIKDDENGYLSDDDSTMSDDILRIIESTELHDRLSNTALEFSDEKNSVAKYKTVLEKIYEESLIG